MNRDELAALLAQTHSPPHSSLHPESSMYSKHSLRSAGSPLSPRQLFQSRIRTLNDDVQSTKQSPHSPTRLSHELERLSSLRVYVRDAHNLSRPHHTLKSHRHESKDGSFAFSPAEPDFVAEERAAWNRELPVKKDGNCVRESLNLQPDDTLQQKETLTLEIDQPDEQDIAVPLLKPFGPMDASVPINGRPKTRRGHGSVADPVSGVFPSEEVSGGDQVVRRSKFMEGSMTDRSDGIASSWNEQGVVFAESSTRVSQDTDSDATPKASRLSRDSDSSFDMSDFRPAPTNSSTIKDKLSRLVKRPNESSTKPLPEEKKQKKKGLRKSISTWSFHNIGEKMKFFGASSTDIPTDQQGSLVEEKDAHLRELNERKRKAEEAYVQQFGTKKQKSNDSIPVQNTQNLKTLAHPRVLKKQNLSERTITPATAPRQRRDVSRSMSPHVQSAADTVKRLNHNQHRRPSRSELEKENQQLRAMLRKQQAQQVGYMQQTAAKSNVHLPLTEDLGSSNTSKKSTSGSASRARSNSDAAISQPLKQKQHRNKGIPPVPALPNRAVLANLGSNGHNNSASFNAADTGTMKRARNGSTRPVSMILEEDVENERDKSKDGSSWKSPTPMLPQRGTIHAHPGKDANWQWPDDVF